MMAQGDSEKSSIPANRLAEASVWVARLHGDDRDEAMELGFRQWLSAHPLNAEAFELATQAWEESAVLRRVMPFRYPTSASGQHRRSMPAWIAVAAMILAVIGAALFFYLKRQEVSTGIGEQRLLVLEDGTRAFLNTATHMTVRYDRGARRLSLRSGEVYFDVASRPDWPFIVQAGEREVRAIGTAFTIRYEAAFTAVTLVTGKVTVSAENAGSASTIALAPGQRLTLDSDKPPKLDTPSLDVTTAWRRGQVVLDDTPLAIAVAEMNRYNTITLTVERPEAAALRVNGLFQAGDSLSFANAIARVYGLRVVERPNGIILAGTPELVPTP